MARTALVTGATGLVGSHIVERLVAEGWQVRALVRRPAAAAWLATLGAHLHEGDILEPSSFTAAARGCDVIFHAAAEITPRGGWETFRRANIDGTGNAIAAAERNEARLLQVSSVAVYGPGRYQENGRPTDESVALQPLPEGAWYPRSKRESEQMVLEAHAAGRIWATAIRPPVVYGARDRQFTPRVARALDRGFAPLPGGGEATLAIIHAANVADGAVRAATTDRAGGRAYNIANESPVTLREFTDLAGEGLGRRVVTVPIPVTLARLALRVAAKVFARTGRRSTGAMTASTVSFLTRDNPFTSERARRELGWTPSVDPRDGIPEAFRWWKAHRAGASA